MNEMAPYLTQLKALVWRNFLVKRRGWKTSLLEVLIPVLLVVAMVLISLGVDNNTTPDVEEFPAHNVSPTSFAPPSSKPILASPDLTFTSDVMGRVTNMLKMTSQVVSRDITSTEMDEEYRERPSMAEVGIEFLWQNKSKGLEVDGYIIRVPHNLFKDVSAQCSYRRSMEKCGRDTRGLSAECPGNQALTSGLLSLQWSVETALIQTFKNSSFKAPALQVEMMPMPAFRPGATNTQLLLSITMVIAMAPLAYCVTVTIVTEKKTWAKVMLKAVGVSDSAFWLTWSLYYVIALLVVCVLATIAVGLGGFFGSSGLGYFFLLVLLYGVSLLGFSFVTSVFFTCARIGGLVASLVSILFGLLYLAVALTRPMSFTFDEGQMTSSALPFGAEIFLSLFSPLGFALGLDRLALQEEEDADKSSTAGQFPLLAAILDLAFDAILYWFLALYLDKIVPSKLRLSEKPWYFFTPTFWRGRHDDDMENDVIPTDTPEGPHIEPISGELAEYKAIRIRDLSKKLSNGKKEPVFGLNGLDLDIFEGQITCILGHPEAGKTTLMKVLAGVMPPTSGVAFVYDLNPSSTSDHADLTSTVAFCPQRDVILDDLSVEEHLYIAAVLRGVTPDHLEHLITHSLHDVNLEKEREMMARELSGCQKRRLSLASALLANTKVLLLDEPTLGMEPEERHHVWQLLHAKKAGRVILFTSRHMEEADYFADRKVVLSGGRLRCVGSSNFLKEQFGVGYHLNVTVRPATSTERLLKAVRSHVRGASLLHCDDNQLTIFIPPLHNAKLTALFKKLESKDRGADYLGICHFSISQTTLEQVFSKMAEEEEAGHVFISPLLTPSDDTFEDFDDDKMPDLHRGSMAPPSLLRSMTAANLEGLRRSSGMPSRQISRSGSDVGGRRKSANARLHMRTDPSQVSANEGGGGGSGGTSITRKLSNIFHMSSNTHNRPGHSSRCSSDYIPDPLASSSSEGSKSRHSSIFKWHKDRSKSLAMGGMTKSFTSNALDSMTSEEEVFEPEKPGFNGIALPTSYAARRATVAAFKDFRRSVSVHANLSGLGSIGEFATMPPDPMAKLDLLDAYQQSRQSSIPDLAPSERLSVTSSMAETSFTAGDTTEDQTPSKDPEKGQSTSLPKIGEVLANLSPVEGGIKLELLKFKAMLKLRVLLCTRDKCALLLRVLIPVVLTLVAVGLSYATSKLNPRFEPSSAHRTHLFGINRLVYKNESGGDVESLLPHLVRPLEGPEHISEYTADLWDPSVSSESLLGVLQPDGSAYKLYYNATCALALPHLVSFVSHVMRDSPTPTLLVNKAYLAPRVSAYLKPWPAQVGQAHMDTYDWIPIIFLGLALLLSPSAYAVRLLRERKNNIRSYLGVAGVSRLVYYGSALIVDVVEFFIPAVLLIFNCLVSKMMMFEDEGAAACLALMVILSVPVGVLFAYASSFIFTRPRTCLVFMPVLLTVVTLSSYCLVHFLDGGDTKTTATVLHYLFCVLWPPYIRFGGLHYIAKVGTEAVDTASVSDFFEIDSNITICFIMLGVDIVVLFILVLVLDKLTLRPPTQQYSTKASLVGNHCKEDDSIKSEIQRIHDLKKDTDRAGWPWLVVERLSQVFTRNKRQLRAVNNATFCVNKGEALGLLGPDGAGKTAVFNSLLGVCSSCEGSVHVASQKVDPKNSSAMCCQIGYCPQGNPLWESLTVDQHVDLIAAVRGIHKKKDVNILKESLYHDLDLDIYSSQKTSKLAECEKRKLSFAMSMLGKQTMMLLDEPSFGMDLRARKMYWDAVSYFIKGSDRSVIVSTHSVDEAQALCSRIAVMVNGQLRCIGSQDELKERYEKNYTLEVSLRGWDDESGPRRMDMLLVFLKELFPTLRPLQQFRERAVFTVCCDSPDFSLAGTFDTLESLKRNLDLEDFTFSQCTLEQLYLDLAREQIEGESKYTSSLHDPSHIPATENTTETKHPENNSIDSKPSSSLARYVEKERGGASCHDTACDADAAEGMVTIHLSGDNDGGGVACGDGAGVTEIGAATPVVFSVEGHDNHAYLKDEQTSV
ncbi:cholesterol transporter ABCA5-like isoform X2 [Littorina saxatilis]|uniref:cholesterol transporter ABCA5-like isoform X2 n=1 Tax=Littorina saxatilis TaxID=31220 RepID=UPI0038B59FEE